MNSLGNTIRASVICLAGSLLASCETAQAPSGPPPVDLSGAQLSSHAASQIFQRACIDQSPRFQSTRAAAVSMGFMSTDIPGQYVDKEQNALIETSSTETGFSQCRVVFLATASDDVYFDALLELPRVARSTVAQLRQGPAFFVDGNGQKYVTFAGLAEFKNTRLRTYSMGVGSSAEQFD
ncbi:hypothetical protein ACJ5NV_01765 [Loktanella agnita]|uniref:hypothetical protein n=1 Tax=Loktanella agnita TaxID=287097 RepID=UPI0039888474